MNTSKKFSIAALVCGILGIVGSPIPVVGYFTFVLAILGIVFGVKGRNGAEEDGKGLATAGLVLGIIGTAFGAVGVICATCTICVAGSVLGSVAGTVSGTEDIVSALNDLASTLG